MSTGDFWRDLTPRERAVLSAMADGLSNRGIAEQHGVTERAIEKTVQQVLWKVTGRFHEREARINRRVLAVLRYIEAAQ